MHLVAGMGVARFLRNDNAIGKHLARFFEATEPRKELAELKISRDVSGIGFEEFFKMRVGGPIVAKLGAFQGQAVAREGISRFLGDELLKNFTA